MSKVVPIRVPMWRYSGLSRSAALANWSLFKRVTVGHWYWINGQKCIMNPVAALGEPIFVPAPKSKREREAYINYLIDRMRGR